MTPAGIAHPAAALRAGFIGLGVMGQPMAGHLLRAGHPLAVWARRAASAAPLLAAGALHAATPAELARASDVVFTIVTADADVEQVLFGEAGVASGAHPGLVVVDHSTIAPQTARDCAARLARLGATLLDAPVSGGEIGARAGRLSVMVGGDAAALERVRPLLAAYGSSVIHVGASGCGQIAKAANQLAICVTMQGIAEAVLYAEAEGIDAARMLEAARTGPAASRILEVMGAKMASGDHAPGVESRLHHKDIGIVLEAARAAGVGLPAAAVAAQTFNALAGGGGARLDSSAIVEVLRRACGRRRPGG